MEAGQRIRPQAEASEKSKWKWARVDAAAWSRKQDEEKATTEAAG
jgi:hypothetical protein